MHCTTPSFNSRFNSKHQIILIIMLRTNWTQPKTGNLPHIHMYIMYISQLQREEPRLDSMCHIYLSFFPKKIFPFFFFFLLHHQLICRSPCYLLTIIHIIGVGLTAFYSLLQQILHHVAIIIIVNLKLISPYIHAHPLQNSTHSKTWLRLHYDSAV